MYYNGIKNKINIYTRDVCWILLKDIMFESNNLDRYLLHSQSIFYYNLYNYNNDNKFTIVLN